MEYPVETLATPEVFEALVQVRRAAGNWRASEERAAASLTIGVTTTPFDLRERVLAALLALSGVPPARWAAPLVAPGRDIVPATPREAFLQLIDRERTYLSNVPIHTPMSRVCRALVRLGVLDRLARLRGVDDLAGALASPNGILDSPKQPGL